MVQNNLAYFAGIVDGEGYFFLEQAKKNYQIPVLGVEMAEKDVITAFSDYFECGHLLVRVADIQRLHPKTSFLLCLEPLRFVHK